MYKIDTQKMSEEFMGCWQAAGVHIQKQIKPGILSWLKADPSPPYLEHLSFRIGNQLFFIRVVDAEGRIDGPGTLNGLQMIAERCNGHACLLPMKRSLWRGSWSAMEKGWGLFDAKTMAPVNPLALVSDVKIEMSAWERHDMAVQIVRDYIREKGYRIMSSQGNPDVDPSIWFLGDSKGPEWIVVRSTQYPANHAKRPLTWDSIMKGCSQLSSIGHFASVAFVSIDQKFEEGNEAPVPLFRGCGVQVNFSGLE